jgi:glycosyltransferase involved in cell wall biosynthesis
MEGGSTDGSLYVMRRWESRLSGWRSHADDGQAAAINEGIGRGGAPFVCWLNSDDLFLPEGLSRLLEALKAEPCAPVVHGRALNIAERTGARSPVWTEPFSEHRLALRCIVSQPATLIRRYAWEAVGGLDASLHMVMCWFSRRTESVFGVNPSGWTSGIRKN